MGNNIYENNIYGTFGKKSSKIKCDNTKHYPNKNEGALLRKLIAETGLSEEEIRDIKKYRVMLSDAQKQGQKPKRSHVKKWYQERIKEACKITGLVPQHPETLKALDEILEDRYSGLWYRPWYIWNKMTANTVVRDYAK